MNKSKNPKPLKVYGRAHYACVRCKINKTKCSGEKPCSNCKSAKKEEACVYITKDRKVVIMESDLNNLNKKIEQLEKALKVKENEVCLDRSPVDGMSDTKLQPHKTDFSEDSTKQNYHSIQGIKFSDKLESYLLYDSHFKILQNDVLETCSRNLPSKEHAIKMAYKVLHTYSSEFYLMDIEEVLRLIDEIYEYFNDAKVAGTYNNTPAPSNTSLSYFFIILGFGEQLVHFEGASSVDSIPVPGVEYYLLATKIFEFSREEFDIQFIQCTLLIALFSSNLCRPNTVYNYFGIAMRSCLARGCHRQPKVLNTAAQSSEQISLAEKFKRLFWTVFVIETTWSSARMSLPVHISYTDTDVDLPCENAYNLNDNFDNEVLEINVQLAKFVAKYVKIIYGPNIRTFSINYINTDQFNQKLLVSNVLTCINGLVKDFEQPYLFRFGETPLTSNNNRNLSNLFLRYHQLLIIITKPLVGVLFHQDSEMIIENPNEVLLAVSKCISASCISISLLIKLYKYNRLFVLGFWDSQHIFSSVVFLILASLTGKRFPILNKGIALLKFMADNHNMNAKQCISKLLQLKDCLERLNMHHLFDISNDHNIITQSDVVDTIDFTLKSLCKSSDYPYKILEIFEPHVEEILSASIGDGYDVFINSNREAIHSAINCIRSWDT